MTAQKMEKKFEGLNWLGVGMFALLMIYPFVVNFIPTQIRLYLSTSIR